MIDLLASLSLLTVIAASAVAAPTINITVIDDNATGYATFQSHNQKVVWNENGIFVSHIRTRNEAYTAQQWRLLRSTDGGDHFDIVHEDTHATNPPVLETDSDNNIYLIRPDFEDGNAYLYRFLATDDYATPLISTLPGGAAGKYAAAIDLPRKQLYFFSHNNRFFTFGLDGEVASTVNLLQPGKDAVLQYPHLALAADGTLHAAWTTQKHGEYMYWSIHHMVSPDGGRTWQHARGNRLELPVVADWGSRALHLNQIDEYDVHTWLSNLMTKADKTHFFYMAQKPTPLVHYLRLDHTTGRLDQHRAPRFGGETLQVMALDGFFATPDQRPDSPLYCVSAYQGRIVCLRSDDNGATWQDHIASESTYRVYALGGARYTLPDGTILGTFTDGGDENTPAKVYLLRITP